jgi:hypothetical protein
MEQACVHHVMALLLIVIGSGVSAGYVGPLLARFIWR